MLTAAVATCVALVLGLAAARVRAAVPQVGSLIGAALAALGGRLERAWAPPSATVRAAITPALWAADLAAYADRVHTTSWQVPVAAGAAGRARRGGRAARPGARPRRSSGGGSDRARRCPGPAPSPGGWCRCSAVAAMAAATVAALFAATAGNALIRAGDRRLLGLYAVATSLARPELTAAICVLLALGRPRRDGRPAPGWPARFGPYRRPGRRRGRRRGRLHCADRGRRRRLARRRARLRAAAPHLLATAAGVLRRRSPQVGSPSPRTGSAGGALAAAAGCARARASWSAPRAGDYLVAVLLLAAAVATAAARAFERVRVRPSGWPGSATVPGAVRRAGRTGRRHDRPAGTAPARPAGAAGSGASTVSPRARRSPPPH